MAKRKPTKTLNISIALTGAERDTIIEAAKLMGMSPSAFARRATLNCATRALNHREILNNLHTHIFDEGK